MTDPNPNRTIQGCLQLVRSAGHHPCQSAIDADLLIDALQKENTNLLSKTIKQRVESGRLLKQIERLEHQLKREIDTDEDRTGAI